MIYIFQNATAILLATLASLLVGVAYGWLIRGRPGSSGVRPTLGLALLAVVAEFWLAAILAGALILAPPGADPAVMAVGSAVVIWIGFVVPVLLVTQRFRDTPPSASLLDCAHWLVAMVLQAGLLHVIGLERPT